MDKKNLTIGVALLLAAFACVFLTAPPPPPPASATAPASAGSQTAGVQPATAPNGPATATTAAAMANTATAAPMATASNSAPAAPLPTAGSLIEPIELVPADAKLVTIENDYLKVRLTEYGGAILDVAFKNYWIAQDKPNVPYVFNERHAAPILAFTEFLGQSQHPRFTLVGSSPTSAVYTATLASGLVVTRTYTLPAPGDKTRDPYLIRHETTFTNPAGAPALPPLLTSLSLGTSERINANDLGFYLTVANFNGEQAAFTDPGDFSGGKFKALIGIGKPWELDAVEKPGPVTWASVNSQFFTSIYTPDQPGTGIISRRVQIIDPNLPSSGTAAQGIGITCAILGEMPPLPPGGTMSMAGDLYVGPKEYIRLAAFAHREDRVMQFDRTLYSRIFLSGYVAPFLNWLMNQTHRLIGNWGFAIVLMTLLLKTISVPFTLAASRSAKRMQKLNPLLKTIREKYKDDPKRLNEATMGLFKEHKVNPFGSCLPVLITIPLFVGFYTMLQGAAELRFQHFLWVRDLSAPDTVGHIFGVAINIMPLLMGATSFFQMRMTPSPSVDSSQQAVMKFMPVLFTLICYNFAAALALYSTINGLFTIGQQLIVNKYLSDNDPATARPGGKPLKNVTPKRS